MQEMVYPRFDASMWEPHEKGIRMFRRRLTDEEYIEKNRKSLLWLNKWGRWPILAFSILPAAGYIGFAALIVNLLIQNFGGPQPGQIPGVLPGFALGAGVGLFTGWFFAHGLDHFKKGLELFLDGDRSSQLMITYHDTLSFIMDKENYVLHDLRSAPENVRQLLEKRLLSYELEK